MIGIIGKKLGMTQIFNEAGAADPLHRGGGHAESRDEGDRRRSRRGSPPWSSGFGAQRVARESKKGERTPKGRRATRRVGHAAKAGLDAPPAVLRVFRLDDAPGKNPEVPTYNVGRHDHGRTSSPPARR